MATRQNVRLKAFSLSLLSLVILGCPSAIANQERQRTSELEDSTPVLEAIDSDALTITYTADDGFLPKRLDIEPSDQVSFVNASDRPFWPASNIHPTHAILPPFDANRPIPQGESWDFTFHSRGYWRFHDHLAPQQGGLVVVLGENDGGGFLDDTHSVVQDSIPLVVVIPDIAFEVPTEISAQDLTFLFRDDEFLNRFIGRFGPAHTVRLLKEGEGVLDVDCHQRAHNVGQAAYHMFGAAAFALAGHECQAGAFHGATEALFASRGTANLEEDVAKVCAVAENPFFRHQCIHGVGHGLMAWTTYELNDALQLCDRMPTEVDQGSCYSGTFMENVVGGLSGVMGHVTQYLRKDDPHFPCDIVQERYLAPCYFYQTSHMLTVFNRDFSKVAQACTEAPQAAHWQCFQSYGRDVGGATRGEPATAIRLCDYAPAGIYRVACIEGAVQDRFWEESGADEALNMCSLLIDRSEQSACYETIIERARHVFSTRHEFDDFCANLDTEWRHMCADS